MFDRKASSLPYDDSDDLSKNEPYFEKLIDEEGYSEEQALSIAMTENGENLGRTNLSDSQEDASLTQVDNPNGH